TRSESPGVTLKQVDVARHPFSIFHRRENVSDPRNSFTTGCAKAARLLCEELLQISYKSHRAGAVIKYNDGSRAQTTSSRSNGAVIHFNIEFDEEIRRCAPRKRTAKLVTIKHATSILF